MMRRFLPTRRASNYIARTDGIDRITDTDFTLSFDNEEHFFIDTVVVKRKGTLARWHSGEVIAKFLRANQWSNHSHTGIKSLGSRACGGEGRGTGLQLDVSNIEDGFRHSALHFGIYARNLYRLPGFSTCPGPSIAGR
ncbi:protein of unknown function [Candidatus Methylocalor cossyra]|uniref:Uncharacterized protein n=1 Tax=Candidatus Methylocalor cossyra TaxID=3108543 RepID=A0ABM9NJ15_9GAMM